MKRNSFIGIVLAIIVIAIIIGFILVQNSNLGSECAEITATDQKDLCYASLAQEKSKPALCENIETTEIKYICYSVVAADLLDYY